MSSPTKALDHRSMMRPSEDTPWSIDVVSAVPEKIMPLSTYHVAATVAHWYCLGNCVKEGNYKFKVWYASPNASLEDQKFQKEVLTLQHHKLTALVGGSHHSPPVLLQMEVNHQKSDETVYVYAANPVTGVMVLWKLSRSDFSKPLAPPNVAIAFCELEDTETLTGLSVSWKTASPNIVAGTSEGRCFWITQSHVPINLHVQLADASRTGLLSRLWTSDKSHVDGAIVAAVCANKEFYSFSEQGSIGHWTVTSSESHKAFFDYEHPIHLLDAMRKQVTAPPFEEIQVLRAAMNADESQIHILVLSTHSEDEARLYWIRLNVTEAGLTWNAGVWLNRFVAPEHVLVAGLIVADNGMGYAAFLQDRALPSIVMTLDTAGMVNEVDLPMPEIPSLIPETLGKDMVTHGCSILIASGVGLRICYECEQPVSQLQSSGKRTAGAVAQLTSHLRSSFWEFYQHPDKSVKLPPSLTMADMAELEEAVIAVAIQLQQKGDVGNTQNPWDYHLAFVNHLQQTGIYRSLSTTCKWRLLAIGQEIAVFVALAGISGKSRWEQEQLSILPSRKVADWFNQVQDSILVGGGGEDRQQVFCEWLCMALDAAMTHREERAESYYYISPEKPPLATASEQVPTWTSQHALQSVLEEQLRMWALKGSKAESTNVEIVVRAALMSFGDSYVSCPTDSTKTTFAQIQKAAISLLRRAKGVSDDVAAFQLSSQYHYFAGLCQISFDHEKKKDATQFSLDPLFVDLRDATDVGTGMSFSAYVLRWHTEKGLIGHAIKYGQHCPDVLSTMMKNDDALRPYRWIQAVRVGDYEGAAESLAGNVKEQETSLSKANFALCMASLANKVVEDESLTRKDEAAKRRKIIENKREHVNAQFELFGENASDSPLWSRENLLRRALDRVDKAGSKDDKVEACFLALAICTTSDSSESPQQGATEVWLKALLADMAFWKKLIRDERDLAADRVRDDVLQRTVFGGLLQRAEENRVKAEVMYTSDLELEVLGKLGDDYATPMRRLLRAAMSRVANPTGA